MKRIQTDGMLRPRHSRPTVATWTFFYPTFATRLALVGLVADPLSVGAIWIALHSFHWFRWWWDKTKNVTRLGNSKCGETGHGWSLWEILGGQVYWVYRFYQRSLLRFYVLKHQLNSVKRVKTAQSVSVLWAEASEVLVTLRNQVDNGQAAPQRLTT